MFRNQVFISDYYKGLFENIKKQILSEKDEYIIQSNLDELVDYYFSKRQFRGHHTQFLKCQSGPEEGVE
jgi:hypothetical protein